MELDQFISTSIKSVIKGINDVQDFASENGATINPLLMEAGFTSSPNIYRKMGEGDGKRFLTKIDFDIAVTASNEDAQKAGGGLKIQVLSFGASTENKESNQTISRIKFEINVALKIGDT